MAVAMALAPVVAAQPAEPPLVLLPPVRGALVAGFSPPGHRGIDLEAPAGRTVLSPVAGEVAFAGQVGGHLWVTVSPRPGVRVSLGYLEQLSVEPGAQVGAGMPLGTAAGQAHPGGPPVLHLSVRIEGRYLDPAPMLGLTGGGRVRLIPEATDDPGGEEPANDAADAAAAIAESVGRGSGQAAGSVGRGEVVLGPAHSIHLTPSIAIDVSALPISIARLLGWGRPPETEEPDDRARYVAFGDSITTGFSVATCEPDRVKAKNGCVGVPPATPYPDLVAGLRGVDAPERVGIWGAKASDAGVGAGEWASQLEVIDRATELVTGALGANDLGWSDVSTWVARYLAGTLRSEALKTVAGVDGHLDVLFDALARAADRGVKVVVPLYYNAFDGPDCRHLPDITEILVSTLNLELRQRAAERGFAVADVHAAFRGHGPGPESWVFAERCSISAGIRTLWDQLDKWCLPCNLLDSRQEQIGKGLQIKFDPHPNEFGSRAIAQSIMEVLG